MSAIIIRLQNLPLSAKAHDIREFFGDLKIPKGSVNIVGGSNGDAFIGFQTDEDARLAMLLDGRLLHQAKIRLMLSSRREMEQVIADAQALAGATKQQIAGGGTGAAASVVQQLGQLGAEVKGAALEEKLAAKLAADQQLATKDGGAGQWKSQIEVPTVASSPSLQSVATFATQQSTTAPTYQQLFVGAGGGGDSWKNPQLPQQNVPLFHQQEQAAASLAVSSSAAPVPVFPGSVQSSFGAGLTTTVSSSSSLGPLVGSSNKAQQQQMTMPAMPQQPPGFPPPLNIPAQPFQQQPRPLPPYAGGGDGFFNQQTPATGYHTQRFSSQHAPANAQQQNFRPGQAVQHQTQFGMPTQGAAGGHYRPSRPPFGRRGGGPFGAGAIQQQYGGGGGVGGGGGPHGMGGGGGGFPAAGQFHHHQQHQQPFQPRQHQYQQRFEGGGPTAAATGGGGYAGPKRRRSRSPLGATGLGKRLYHGPSARGTEAGNAAPVSLFPPQHHQPMGGAFMPSAEAAPPVKERVCVQLSNVPYKATFFDVKQYLASTNAECVKVTRVYQPDRNYSDRWIVEFDNERDARSVIRHHGEINNRTIRTERIPARKADEQYAVTEPDDKDRPEKRSSDEPSNRRERDRGGRGDRDRPRDRDRDRGASNRSRSPPARGGGGRSGRGRSTDQNRSSHSDKGAGGGNGGGSASSMSAATSTTTASTTTTTATAVWAKEEQQQQRTKSGGSGGDEKTKKKKNGGSGGGDEEEGGTGTLVRAAAADSTSSDNGGGGAAGDTRQGQQVQQQQLAMESAVSAATAQMNLISNAAVFGAFSFPDNHHHNSNNNNGSYRPRAAAGSAVAAAQLGTKTNEPKPLRAFEFFPAPPATGAVLAAHRPPIPLNHLEGSGGAGGIGGVSSSTGGRSALSPPLSVISQQQQQQHQAASVAGLMGGAHNIPSLIRPTSASNVAASFWPRQANAATASPGTAAASTAVPLLGGAAVGRQQQLTGLASFANPATTVQQLQSTNANLGGGRPPVHNKSIAAAASCFNTSVASLDTSFGSTVPGLVIQEDYSMDEAESDNDTTTAFATAQNGGIPDQPPLDLLEPDNHDDGALSSLYAAPQAIKHTKTDKREFTAQELELRPHLSFLERYREDPNLNSCIRLENVPKMVYAEQLADFLGVQFDSPYENIARMQNGVLYINLPNEAMATKAAAQNMHMLNGHQIVITQLKRAEMADAIRQNMIIIREMCRVSVVVRGFPLVTQLNEVVALFDRFHLNKEGAEKCTVKPNDTVSTFLLTFASAQDCRNAIREMNDAQIAGGAARIKVFQPTDVAC